MSLTSRDYLRSILRVMEATMSDRERDTKKKKKKEIGPRLGLSLNSEYHRTPRTYPLAFLKIK